MFLKSVPGRVSYISIRSWQYESTFTVITVVKTVFVKFSLVVRTSYNFFFKLFY